ncbi:MAG TPA: alpha/beta hydrolase domain-containing protein [Acidimicrobiales bacterium]|nr:alpha/beta hydrolase domain-containing protein [Acidimicrobiales bacterium]
MPRGGTALAALAALVALFPLTIAAEQPAGAATSSDVTFHSAATLTGPVTVGHVVEPESAHPPDLATNGYEEQEYFASGTAMAFKADAMPSDGKWTVTPTTTAAYKTRILVRRPTNPAHFNGTVIVEWMNVSAGESAPDWDFLNPMLMRDGYAYVGVSAQALGVDGGQSLLGTPDAAGATGPGGLIGSEPARYGTLHHPGDQYALDMYAQIGQALDEAHPAALGGVKPKHILAVGESQSAFYLTTFADAIQPRTDVYNGIFIHSRGGSGASLSGTSIKSSTGPDNLRIRTDLKVPVFMSETQTDLIQLGYAPAQQPNTSKIRTWEIAGTSHADAYFVGAAASILGCTTPVNSGPQHNVVQAAFTAFDKWVDNGTPPPSPPPFHLSSTDPATLALDAHGNVVGGVRTPAVDVPVSTLSGAPPAGASPICSLFGSTVAFPSAQLASLYTSKSNYIAEYTKSLDKAVAEGYILGADKASLLAEAEQVQFPAS